MKVDYSTCQRSCACARAEIRDVGEERRLNNFVFGLQQPPECESQFGEKRLYLSPSLLHCFPSCTTPPPVWIISQLWVCPKTSFFSRCFEGISTHTAITFTTCAHGCLPVILWRSSVRNLISSRVVTCGVLLWGCTQHSSLVKPCRVSGTIQPKLRPDNIPLGNTWLSSLCFFVCLFFES